MERCLFLLMVGLLLFSWPLLEIFRNLLISYLYGIWLLYIVVLAIAVHGVATSKRSPEDGRERGRQ